MASLRVSVVIPVYNAEQYIDDCIRSVLEQTYPLFEVILVDDGSTDNCGKICDEYTAQNPTKFRTIHTPNRGALLARESGVDQAQGDVLVFLDSDDCLRKDALEVLVRLFMRVDCDMVLYSASSSVNYEPRELGVPYKDEACFSGEAKKQVLRDLVAGKVPNSLCLKAVKTDLYNLAYDRTKYGEVRHGEDLLISALLIERANSVAVSDQNLYYYRRHAGSVTTSYNPKYIQSVGLVHRELEKRIDLWEIPECRLLHYARIVRSWVQAAKNICKSTDISTVSARNKKLKECAEDTLFIRAYLRKNNAGLNLGDKLVAWCLFHGAFVLLQIVCGIGSGFSRIKHMRKRIFSRGT